ncbi:MAG: flagellar biosynthesis anti-sigma factor FlgM [Gemmatimonadetes bacterium]|nr:flagellar biosynthesis anti-sigma factor FlgM [Gemmatimonadota bacterium]MCC6770842.1 flagellar biosynthesis anti-sigma factor FlgM [Gemmatimonadaceae bacterium]
MKIHGGQGGPLRPDRPREITTQPVGPRERDGARTPAQVEKLDRVEISDAGRAKASHLEPTASGTRERLAEVRRRVLTGAYNADAVVGEVARRIIDRGDA